MALNGGFDEASYLMCFGTSASYLFFCFVLSILCSILVNRLPPGVNKIDYIL